MEKNKISVIICTANKPYHLLFTIQKIYNIIININGELIIIDNGKKNVPKEILHNYSKLKYVKESYENRAKARNQGAQLSSGNILFFLDDDIIINDNFFIKQLYYLNNYPSGIIIGQTLNTYNFIENTNYIYDIKALKEKTLDICKKGKADNYRSIFFETIPLCSKNWCGFYSSNMCILKRNWIKLGGFDEKFVGWGIEDFDFAFRATNNGMNIIYAKDIKSFHICHLEGKENFLCDFKKNTFYFYKKHLQNRDIAIWWDFFRGIISIETLDKSCFEELENVPDTKQHFYSDFRRYNLSNIWDLSL